MSTPIGHALLGAAVGAAFTLHSDTRRAMLIGSVIGVSADVDFIPGLLLGDPSRFHQGPTHSLFMAIVIAGAAALLWPRMRGRWTALTASAYTSHLLLDYLTVDDSLPVGIPVFWPVEAATYSADVLPQVVRSSAGILNSHNWWLAFGEFAVLGSICAILLFVASRVQRSPVTSLFRGRPHA